MTRIEINNPYKIKNADLPRILNAPTGIDFIISRERRFNIRIEGDSVIITSNGDTFERIRIEPVSGNALIIK